MVSELEATVIELGEETWELEPEWCEERFGEFYDGGWDAFGRIGPSDHELLEAYLWFLHDCPLPGGETPLWRLRGRSPSRAVELLGRSELRAWRIESVGAAGMLTALCPLGTGRVRLESVRPPSGEIRPGAMVVARSVPLGPERWALLGSVPVVEQEVAAEFDALLASLDAPRGEFWRVHGGVLARAAWAWPEEREVTIDAEIVVSSLLKHEAADPLAVISALRADPELVECEPDPDGAARWRWRWSAPARIDPTPEPGVRYELCEEDADERVLADVTVEQGAGGLVWLTAPTPSRLALAQRLILDRLGPLLGAEVGRSAEPPECVPRWKRLRWEAVFERHAARLGREAA